MLGPLVVLAAMAALLLGGAQRATASPDHVFTVSTTTDAGDAIPGDGTCADSAGQCTLRAAVEEAEALGGTSEIDVYPGTFDLTLDQLEVGGNIAIKGAGADQTTIEQLAATHRAFEVTSGTVSIIGTTITGGDETMNSNDPDPGVGGGIYVAGGATLDLSWAEVTGNGSESSGGGIDLNGSVDIDHSTVANNAVSGLHFGNGIGGGVDDFGASLAITDSTIYGNTASLQGGGLLSASSTTLTNDTIVGQRRPDRRRRLRLRGRGHLHGQHGPHRQQRSVRERDARLPRREHLGRLDLRPDWSGRPAEHRRDVPRPAPEQRRPDRHAAPLAFQPNDRRRARQRLPRRRPAGRQPSARRPLRRRRRRGRGCRAARELIALHGRGQPAHRRRRRPHDLDDHRHAEGLRGCAGRRQVGDAQRRQRELHDRERQRHDGFIGRRHVYGERRHPGAGRLLSPRRDRTASPWPRPRP